MILAVRCRVLGSKPLDHYDAHGNVSKTSKTFYLRADDIIELKTDTPEAYKARIESEDDAVAEAARLAQQGSPNGNGSAAATPQDREPGTGKPAGDRHLASA